MLRKFPSHLCTKMQLHSADNKLRIKSLESLSSRSHYQLSRYKFGTERCFPYRDMRDKGSFTDEAKLDYDNYCSISKYKLL